MENKSESMAFIPMKEYEELKQKSEALSKLVCEKKPIVITHSWGTFEGYVTKYYCENVDEKLKNEIEILKAAKDALRKENEMLNGSISYYESKPKKWYQILFNL